MASKILKQILEDWLLDDIPKENDPEDLVQPLTDKSTPNISQTEQQIRNLPGDT